MNAPAQVTDLEAALLVRAQNLAEEYLKAGRSAHERIVEETGNRLRLREEREILAAKARAERLYRQRVQAAEIKLQEELDRLRWALVQSAIADLKERLAKTADDETRYLPLLHQYLAHAAAAIESDDLSASFNKADRERLHAGWNDLCQKLAPGKRIALAGEALDCAGGVLVRSTDSAIRVDNTFEGRIERMEEELYRVVTERLFASATAMGALFGG